MRETPTYTDREEIKEDYCAFARTYKRWRGVIQLRTLKHRCVKDSVELDKCPFPNNPEKCPHRVEP